MDVVVFPEDAVPHDLRVQAMALQDQAWPPEGPSDPAPWHDPTLDPTSLLLVEGERVVAALDILSKSLRHASETFRASGISAMVTDERLRGRGYGTVLASAAREMMRERGADLGVFTCDSPLRSFYERAGWRCLVGSVLVGGTPEDPFPSDQFDKVTMACFFSARAVAAQERFEGVRIELFPGSIDKLW